MNLRFQSDKYHGGNMSDGVKNWMMVLLALFFVMIYASALLGLLRPFADVTVVTRLEPIIFVIIGFYFGRLPSQSNETALKEEIENGKRKLETSMIAKEAAEKERDVIEEKTKNARIALIHHGRSCSPAPATGGLEVAVETAVKILDS